MVSEKKNDALIKDHHIRTGRHLLEANTSNVVTSSGTLVKGKDCILFYFKGMKLQFEGKENKTLDFMNSSLTFTANAVCPNGSDTAR